MAKKKHFITQKMINTIIQKYGGGHKWSLREDISEHSIVTYTDIKGRMLTINLMWEGKQGQFPYIEVHITTTDGIIYRRDRYDFKDTEYKVIEFVYTEENGHFYDDFRKVGVTMAKETKESKIKKLEEKVAMLEKCLEQSSKNITEMQQRGEDSYLNSPTYHQMQQQISFYKAIADLNQMHIDSQRKWGYRQDDKVQQVYEDNKRFMEQAGEEYHIGCMVREETEYEKLREEIRELKGALDGKNLNLVARDKMIADMMEQIAELQAENDTLRQIADDMSLDKSEAIRTVVQATHADTVDKAVQTLTDALEEAQTTITVLRKKAEKAIVAQNKAEMTRLELRRLKNSKFDGLSESDEMSYDALVHSYNTAMNLLESSNATHDRLVEEIKTLREQLTRPDEENTTTAPSVTEKALQEQIESLQTQLRKAEGQCKVYEANVRKLSERREEIAKLLGEANQKISELESQRDAIFSRNSDPDIVTMYHQLEDRIANALISLKKSKDEVKKWKSMYQELKEQIPTTPTTPPTEDKEPQSVGRPKTDDEKIQKVLQMRENGLPMRKIAKELGISLGTVSNIVKQNTK